MSVRAYVLIGTAVGKIRDVFKALDGAPGVKSVDAVTGAYDVIAVIEGEDLNTVSKLVTQQLQAVHDISRAMTCLAVDLA